MAKLSNILSISETQPLKLSTLLICVTCMFPIKSENRIKPDMHMKIANSVSPRYMVVSKFCPYELQQKEHTKHYV